MRCGIMKPSYFCNNKQHVVQGKHLFRCAGSNVNELLGQLNRCAKSMKHITMLRVVTVCVAVLAFVLVGCEKEVTNNITNPAPVATAEPTPGGKIILLRSDCYFGFCELDLQIELTVSSGNLTLTHRGGVEERDVYNGQIVYFGVDGHQSWISYGNVTLVLTSEDGTELDRLVLDLDYFE